MSKIKKSFVCTECGAEHSAWQGLCKECGQGGTIKEISLGSKSPRVSPKKGQHWAGQSSSMVSSLADPGHTQVTHRTPSGMNELDRVLGGGWVEGSVVLIGGEPGIGKSTLLLQALNNMNRAGKKTLNVSGEESLGQISDRAKRLGIDARGIRAMAETDLSLIQQAIEDERPDLVVVDSIQTIAANWVESAAGSVSQTRECAAALTRQAKTNNFTLVLIGHITKDGNIAGPRILEHLVDTVLFFESDGDSVYRLIRTIKNRFGSAMELGAFEMTSEGLISVDNPSSMFLTMSSDRGALAGAAVALLQEGTRAMLVEIQALVNDALGQNPRRLAVGVDANRMAMLLGILYKHADLSGLGGQDVFVNAVGGIKAVETAADLPMLLALVSSLQNRPIPQDIACFGEIGLTGEVRPVVRAEVRIQEALRQGFKTVILPKRNLPKSPPKGIHLVGVSTAAEALNALR